MEIPDFINTDEKGKQKFIRFIKGNNDVFQKLIDDYYKENFDNVPGYAGSIENPDNSVKLKIVLGGKLFLDHLEYEILQYVHATDISENINAFLDWLKLESIQEKFNKLKKRRDQVLLLHRVKQAEEKYAPGGTEYKKLVERVKKEGKFQQSKGGKTKKKMYNKIKKRFRKSKHKRCV
jgi:hypothetical protein